MKYTRVKSVVFDLHGVKGWICFDNDGKQIPELNYQDVGNDEGKKFFLDRLYNYWADKDTEFVDGRNMKLPNFKL